MATGNTNYTAIITKTLQDMGTEIFDAVSTNNALLWMLKKRDNIKVRPGGRAFTHPIWYKANSSFKMYSKLDTIATPIMDDYTRAEYPIKIAAGSLVLSTFDEACNAGDKTKILDEAETVRLAAERSMSQLLATQLFSTGGLANDFDGLQFLINDAPGAQTDVGGIDASASGNDYWRNYAYPTAVAAFNTSNAGIISFDTTTCNTTFGNEGPRAIVTTKAIYMLYTLAMVGNIRYVTTELADSGFQHLAYATMPVLFDDNCPASHAYFIDLDNLWLQTIEKGNMKVTAFENSTNQLLKTALMYFFGNLTTGSRRTQGVVPSITA